MNIFRYVPIICFMILLTWVNSARADLTAGMAACARIEDNAGRLRCYDDLAKRQGPVQTKTPETAAAETKNGSEGKESVLSRQWELDPESRGKAPIIRAHRPTYILPVSYNNTPNRNVARTNYTDENMQHTEAKFQLSFKTKLWEDIAGKKMDLWFGYTQLAFWQMYNSAFSSPFRDTNYEPELLLNFRTDYDLLGLGLLRGRIINLGFNHQSNGRAEPLSRSWNRIVANFGFEKNDFNLLLKTWYRIPESAMNDDNTGIEGYLGYGELWAYYYWGKHKFDIMFRNNLRFGDNRGAVQVDWAFPLTFIPFIKNDRISGYIQYFNGYGEGLLDYNASSNRISLGFMLTDWK